MKRNLTAKRGFSLVEVAMALAIAAFCLLTLMGLLSLGVHNYQQSGSRTTMVNLSTAVVQDLQAAPANSTANSLSPRFQFNVAFPGSGTATPTPQTAFVDANGVGMNGNALGSTTVYRISVAFFPPAAGLNSATTARVIVSYPAQADPTAGAWPTNYTSMFETMVSLNRN
jgi:uncharacterized protein (TIGR02598 family)